MSDEKTRQRAEAVKLSRRGHDGDERCALLAIVGAPELPRRRGASETQGMIARIEGWAAWLAREPPEWDEKRALEAHLHELDGLARLVGAARGAVWGRLIELHDEESEET